MDIVCSYKTKASWTLHTYRKKPIFGWYTKGAPGDWQWRDKKTKACKPGENFLYHGNLTPDGMGRGRSSVSFYFKDKDDVRWTLSASGMLELLNCVATGDVKVVPDEDGNVFRGYWTITKQGTEVTLAPLTSEKVSKLIS